MFDLSFVALCVALALMVRPRDFFTIGVLPPLMMLGVVLLLAVAVPGAVSTRHSDLVGTVDRTYVARYRWLVHLPLLRRDAVATP